MTTCTHHRAPGLDAASAAEVRGAGCAAVGAIGVTAVDPAVALADAFAVSASINRAVDPAVVKAATPAVVSAANTLPLARAVAAAGASRRWRAADLFGPALEIEIQHGAAIYRLRQTALGKLILTK